MKGLYIVDWNLSNDSDGVVKKIRNQIACFEKELGSVDVIDQNSLEYSSWQEICNKGLSLLRLSGIYRGSMLLKSRLSDKNYVQSLDYIYIRKFVFTKVGIAMLENAKKCNPKLKILVEIPTYPYDKEFKIYNMLNRTIDRKTRGLLYKVVDRIVTYSDDVSIFGVQTVRISNGANYSTIQIRQPVQHDGINVIAVALFDSWHGYDRFIEGMKRDIDIVKQNNIKLHLVGRGRAVEGYQKLVDSSISDNVIFYGPKFGDELDSIYNSSDIALDAMGRHRSDVYYNSSLKGKEYCAKGIPSISGVKTELDFMKEADFYFRVPADETPINMSDVVSFYHKMYDSNNHESVCKRIRENTIGYFDFENVMKPVIGFLRG